MATITVIAASDQITDSRSVLNNNFAALNSDKIETSYLDTDTALSANSDTKIPTQKAVKTYIDTGGSAAYISSLIPTGLMLPYGGSAAPTNWFLCDGTAKNRTTYATLFAIIGTTFGVGDGSTTFNLPDLRGRVPLGNGAGTLVESGVNAAIDTGGDTFTVVSNNTKWVTGMAVVFTLASGTITGLTSGNTYYVIRASATTIQLASTLANAQNGIPIDLTAKSSPVWSLTVTLTTRTLGEQGGEEAHAMSITELLAHIHTTNALADPPSGGGGGSASRPSTTATIASTGGNAAMNVMSPFVAVNYIIKYT